MVENFAFHRTGFTCDIPLVVYWYCRFYKKPNNAATVQQGTVNCSGSSEDQKTISPSFNVSFSSPQNVPECDNKGYCRGSPPSPRTLNFLQPPPVTQCRNDLNLGYRDPQHAVFLKAPKKLISSFYMVKIEEKPRIASA